MLTDDEKDDSKYSSAKTSTDIFSAVPLLRQCLRAGLVPILRGPPGIGKSAVMRSVCKEFRLKLIDLRLAQLDPTDLNGFPAPDMKTGRATFLVPEVFPVEDQALPKNEEGKELEGWMLFFDEISNAPNSVQGAAFKLILDRMVGQHNLHKRVVMAAAGNRETDRAAAGKLNTAMQSRLVHIDIHSDQKLWCEWAIQENFDTRIISFLNFKPDLMNNFQPSNPDRTYACERTWEMINKLLKAKNPNAKKSSDIPLSYTEDFILLSGVIGKAAAMEFTLFAEIFNKLPDINDIINDPDYALYPSELDVRWALTGAVAEVMNENNVEKLIRYVLRMPIEFQIITIRTAIKRCKELRTHREISKWSIANANRLARLDKVGKK